MSGPTTIGLRPEEPGDAAAIRRIHYLAFNGEAEADAVDTIRAADAAVLSLVAEEVTGPDTGAAARGQREGVTLPTAGGALRAIDSPTLRGADYRLVGHVLFTRVTVATDHGDEVGLLGLAPVAVLPSYQGQGVGTMLIEAGLEQLRAAGHPAVVVLGHPSYYPRFGFVPASRFGLRWEIDAPDEAFMAMELSVGALSGIRGVVRFRPEFSGI
jgi:putative acetyltransferase